MCNINSYVHQSETFWRNTINNQVKQKLDKYKKSTLKKHMKTNIQSLGIKEDSTMESSKYVSSNLRHQHFEWPSK